jgi:hypothetical protein
MQRLDEQTHAFREGLHRGQSIATALAMASAAGDFDPGRAVAALFGDGLVAEVSVAGAGR